MEPPSLTREVLEKARATLKSSAIYVPRVSLALLLCSGLCLLTPGCATSRFKESADKESYALIQEKTPAVPGMDSEFSIDVDAAGPQLDGLPVVAESDLSLGGDGTAELGSSLLSLERALSLAVRHNRNYQNAKEQLYLQALSLTLERHRYKPILSAGASAQYTRDTIEQSRASDFTNALAEAGVAIDALEALSGGTATLLREYANLVADAGAELGLDDPRTETQNRRSVSGGASVGMDVLLKGGGRLALDLTTNLLRYLVGTGGDAGTSAITATFTQPLLRGAGAKVAAERLTQAERDLLYALRDFTQFRKDFTVDICSSFYNVLQGRDIVRNTFTSYQNFLTSVERERAFAAEGRRTQADLGRLEQARLSAENNWVNALRRYREDLDRFKIQLGLSTDARVALEDDELALLQTQGLKHPILSDEEAVQVAMTARLDIYTRRDSLEDADRQVVVAANALKPGLSLIAQASAPTQGTNQPANFDFNRGQWSLGADLDLPLDRKAERNNYRATLIARERALRELTLSEDNVKLEVRAAWRNLDQARRNFEVAQRSVELNQRRVEEQGLLADLGRATALNQIDAQNDLTRAQNDLTAALVAHTIARLAFWRDMGILYIKADGQWEEIEDGGTTDHTPTVEQQ